MIEYEIVGVTEDGSEKIKFINAEFNDIVFSIGKVYFTESEFSEPKLNFQYNIHSHQVKINEIKEFENILAMFILERIKVGLENNDLVYTGGIDED